MATRLVLVSRDLIPFNSARSHGRAVCLRPNSGADSHLFRTKIAVNLLMFMGSSPDCSPSVCWCHAVPSFCLLLKATLLHKTVQQRMTSGRALLGVWLLKHLPGLVYWWMTQKLFRAMNVMEKNPVFFNERDQEVLKRTPGFELLSENKLENKGVFENIRRDFMVGLGKWEFDPLKLSNPYPEMERSLHLWAGYEDRVVPVELQWHVSGTLPWMKHHEVPHGGHMIVYDSEVC